MAYLLPLTPYQADCLKNLNAAILLLKDLHSFTKSDVQILTYMSKMLMVFDTLYQKKKTIALAIGISTQTVRRAIRKFEKAGLLLTLKQYRKNRQISNCYKFILDVKPSKLAPDTLNNIASKLKNNILDYCNVVANSFTSNVLSRHKSKPVINKVLIDRQQIDVAYREINNAKPEDKLEKPAHKLIKKLQNTAELRGYTVTRFEDHFFSFREHWQLTPLPSTAATARLWNTRFLFWLKNSAKNLNKANTERLKENADFAKRQKAKNKKQHNDNRWSVINQRRKITSKPTESSLSNSIDHLSLEARDSAEMYQNAIRAVIEDQKDKKAIQHPLTGGIQ
jgi:hypothetical protein